jgi:hypothetical protein
MPKPVDPSLLKLSWFSLQYMHHVSIVTRAPDWLLVTVLAELLVAWNTCNLLDVLLPLELVGTCGQLVVNVSKGTDQVNWLLAFSPVLRICMVFISVVDP